MANLTTRLGLYLRAVQHPEAEAGLLQRMHGERGVVGVGRGAKPQALGRGSGEGGREKRDEATTLREDFAGTAAVAAAWVERSAEHQAVAIEKHPATAKWAWQRAKRVLGERVDDLHVMAMDVMAVTRSVVPAVDVIAALNFSSFIYHDRASMLAYLRSARKGLHVGGVLVLDCFGGPGSMRPGVQRRVVSAEEGDEPFVYEWEQVRFEAATGRIECAIQLVGVDHPDVRRLTFGLRSGAAKDGSGAWRIERAFVYRWRLWSPMELREAMLEVGFDEVAIWCDRFDVATGTSDGVYRPGEPIGSREDWIAYVVGRR